MYSKSQDYHLRHLQVSLGYRSSDEIAVCDESYQIEMKQRIYESAGDESVYITDDVDTCYSNQSDYQTPILNQSIGIIDLDFSVSDGFHKDHQGCVFPMDVSIPILPNGDLTVTSPDLIPNGHYSTAFQFTHSEAEIDTLLSLGRQGLLETHISKPQSSIYISSGRSIQICKFFLDGVCRFGTSGKNGAGVCKYIHLKSSILERIGSHCYRSSGHGNKLSKKQKSISSVKRLNIAHKGVHKCLQWNGLKPTG